MARYISVKTKGKWEKVRRIKNLREEYSEEKIEKNIMKKYGQNITM